MVSSGTVSNTSSEFKQASSKYASKVGELSSSWKGSSHDNLENQASEFSSKMQQVTSQIDKFANAVKLYESYMEVKKSYESYVSSYNQAKSSENSSSASYYSGKISECESKMTDYSSKIRTYLSEASSFKMEGASTLSLSDLGSVVSSTPDNTTDVLDVSTEGGEFVADNKKGVYGHITIDGKTFTVYRQSQIEGWGYCCNRAAAASIASAYESRSGDAVAIAKKAAGGLGYNSKVTEKYFSNFGLTSKVKVVKGSYDKVKKDIVSNLKNGNYVMFDLDEANVKGKSGQKWTSTRHWLSILDIKKTGSGENDYAIFVSDSGHKGSTVDRGLGTGWYSLDEFSGQKIKNFTTVSPTKKA